MTTTEILRCNIVELAAIERQARGDRQHDLLRGVGRWTRRDHALLERLRDVRGLSVIEHHGVGELHVTICGSMTIDGFARRIR